MRKVDEVRALCEYRIPEENRENIIKLLDYLESKFPNIRISLKLRKIIGVNEISPKEKYDIEITLDNLVDPDPIVENFLAGSVVIEQ